MTAADHDQHTWALFTVLYVMYRTPLAYVDG